MKSESTHRSSARASIVSSRCQYLGSWRLASALFTAAVIVTVSSYAHESCDVIPQPETVFLGATGSVNRVYATPGDNVRVSRDPAGCEATTPAFGADPDVTLIFQLPQGPVNLVVLGGDGGAEGTGSRMPIASWPSTTTSPLLICRSHRRCWACWRAARCSPGSSAAAASRPSRTPETLSRARLSVAGLTGPEDQIRAVTATYPSNHC